MKVKRNIKRPILILAIITIVPMIICLNAYAEYTKDETYIDEKERYPAIAYEDIYKIKVDMPIYDAEHTLPGYFYPYSVDYPGCLVWNMPDSKEYHVIFTVKGCKTYEDAHDKWSKNKNSDDFKKYAHMGDWLRANLTAERGYISSNSDSNYMEIIFDRRNSNDEYNNQNNRIGFIVAISAVLCVVIVTAITAIIIIKRKKSKLKNEIPPQNN